VALVVSSGALVALSPLGLSRLPLSEFAVVPPAGWGALLVGLPHTSLLASALALIGWSAAVPFLLATVVRAVGFRTPGALGTAMPLAAGLSFGWAGLLLQAALFRSVYLPWLPAALTPVWLLLGAMISWGAGRGLLAGRRSL
jgi:hypothetical protein